MRVLPRRFRPHTIQLIKIIQEDEQGNAITKEITISHVKVDPTWGIQQSKRGITSDDNLIAYIELQDYTAYDNEDESLSYGVDFSVQTDDQLIFHDHTYLITKVNEILLDDDRPIRLELIAK